MPRSPAARKLLLTAWFLAWTVLITYAALIIEVNRLPVRVALASGLLAALRVIFAVIAIFGLLYTWLLPWLLRQRPVPGLRRTSRFFGMTLGPEYQPLLRGLVMSSAPASYGLVLFLLGAPVRDIYPFAGAAFVGTTLWGLYNVVRPVTV
jgi:hypothetical protein